MHIQPVRRTAFALVLAVSLGGCAALSTNEAVVVCQAADTITTLQAVDAGAREMNPVARFLLEEFGPGASIAAKIGVTLLVLHYYPVLSSDVVIFINGLTCGVAAHNAWVTYQIKQGKTAE